MKILTILGTRPEIIRLSRVIHKLDCHFQQIIIHTGQNFDRNLNELFFEELGVRRPDHYLGAKGSFGEQIATVLAGTEKVILQERPDRFLVLGDTNSSMGAVVAKRLGVPVYHMEAGNRCFDDRVPEEINRRVIDHSSDVLMPYSERSRQNLLREGIASERIFVTGNPIFEVIQHYGKLIDDSGTLASLNLNAKHYFLVTIHRAENVDVEERLRTFVGVFDRLQKEYGFPVVVSTHPRTRMRMQAIGLDVANPEVQFMQPFGFFDFIALERNAFCVLSDSGTVQEECSILGVPSVVIRDTTERPETIECGSGMLSGAHPDLVPLLVKLATHAPAHWDPPIEYRKLNVSDTVVNIIASYSRLR